MVEWLGELEFTIAKRPPPPKKIGGFTILDPTLLAYQMQGCQLQVQRILKPFKNTQTPSNASSDIYSNRNKNLPIYM